MKLFEVHTHRWKITKMDPEHFCPRCDGTWQVTRPANPQDDVTWEDHVYYHSYKEALTAVLAEVHDYEHLLSRRL